VLGASGFLGLHLVRRGAAAGSGVTAVARSLAGPVERVAGVRLRPADLVAEVEAVLDEVGPERVLLAAALARIDDCEREPERARATNAELPERVARWCAARGARLVHVSTDLVFDGRPPRPAGYREDDATGPLHVYGKTKAEGEARVLAADPAALVARIPLLYGDSLGRGLGASDQLLAALARGQRPVLFADEWRTPLDAANAADAVLELVAGDVRGLLHVAGPERLSRLALGLVLLAARGHAPDAARARVRATTREELGMSARPSDVALDARRARTLHATRLLGPREALGSA
jgi:dTDP-4-dehydrorhamnose reductase